MLSKKYNVRVKPLQLLIIFAVFLGVFNVLSNIILPLSILHLAIADFLWISYIYVSIDLSIDGGATWDDIDYYESSDGNYSWTVPNIYSEECKIKISNYE